MLRGLSPSRWRGFAAGPIWADVVLTGGGLALIEEGPAAAMAGDPNVPANLALGAMAFALDELDLGVYFIGGVTNGSYGNSSSWIGGGAAGPDGPLIGVDLGDAFRVDQVAFGRSNVLAGDPCGGGVCTDCNLAAWCALLLAMMLLYPVVGGVGRHFD